MACRRRKPIHGLLAATTSCCRPGAHRRTGSGAARSTAMDELGVVQIGPALRDSVSDHPLLWPLRYKRVRIRPGWRRLKAFALHAGGYQEGDRRATGSDPSARSSGQADSACQPYSS